MNERESRIHQAISAAKAAGDAAAVRALTGELDKRKSYESRLITAIGNAKAAGDDVAVNALTNELRGRFGTAPGAPDIDYQTGAPASTRLGMSFKVSPEGQKSYLESQFGPGSVGETSQGDLTFLNPSTGRETAVNPHGVDLGDFTGRAGDILEGAVGLLSRTPNPLAVGGLLGGADMVRQGISGLLPGDDAMSLEQRAARVGGMAALGAASQAGANIAATGLDKARPSNLVANYARGQLGTPTASRADVLERTFPGLGLSQGQRTGSKSMLTMEGFARRHPASADKVQGFDLNNIRAVERGLDGLLNMVDKRGLGAENVGIAVSKSFGKALDGRLSLRRAQAKADFGAVHDASKGAARVPVNNAKKAIDALIEEFDVPGGGDATANLVNKLKSVRNSLGDAVNPLQMERLLEVWGKAAGGRGQVFENIDKAQQMMVANRFQAGLLKDIDGIIASGGVGDGITAAVGGGAQMGSEAMAALKTARANYAKNSAGIEELRDSVLGRVFGGKFDPAPESIAAKFQTMKPSEIRTAARILDEADPATMQAVRRNVLEDIIDSSKTYLGNVPQQGRITRLDSGVLSPRRARTAFEKRSDQLQALGYKPSEVAQMKRAYETLVRLGDDAGMGGSPTQPLAMAEKVADLAVESAATANPAGIAQKVMQIGGRLVVPQKVADRLMTESGRKKLMEITLIPDATKRRAAAAAYIGLLGPTGDAVRNLSGPQEAQKEP